MKNGLESSYEQDHPRVCGENFVFELMRIVNRGSPPRVRGKLAYISILFIISRITPACAGKTLKIQIPVALFQDHPRVCGENQDTTDTDSIYLGSPPRVRGKPLNAICSPPNSGDHPRVCGENTSPC